MGKSHKKGSGRGSLIQAKTKDGSVEWTPKMTMNMSDLSRDDDFLNHLLVEKLGTANIPLYVHKMDPMRPLPKTDPKDLISIVQRLIVSKGPAQKAIKQAVDELLKLHAVRTFIKKFSQLQIDAFATHASRYFELYLPSGSIEIAHTSRYTHRTGKSELCILATRHMAAGTVITELKGSMAKLTKEDEKELKRNSDIRRDFSVIHSGQMKKNHLFLGPARFVNHDCENNCELFREGKYITFRVLRPIVIGEEITAHYGDGYFGRKNRHCLCATCEKNGSGGYALQQPNTELLSGLDSDSDSDTSSSDLGDEAEEKPQVPLNINERRTRRGVYHIAQGPSDDSDDSESEDKEPKKEEKEVTKQEEKDFSSELSSLPPSRPSDVSPARAGPSRLGFSRGEGMMTPETDIGAFSSPQAPSAATATDETPTKSTSSTPYKSIIATRRQKAAAAGESISTTSTPTISKSVKVNTQLVTPPPSVETASLPDEPTALVTKKRVTRSISSAMLVDKNKTEAMPVSTKSKDKKADDEAEEPEVTRVLRTRPSAHVNPSVVGSPVKPEIPRDERGRPLPTCITCFNILPIIHVDQQVVWGVGKKKEMPECPRCMRHFAIYSHPWPARTPGQRARFMPTPREELTPVDPSPRRITAKVLPALDRKLAAAAKSPSKLRRSESSVGEPPAKKRKTETGSKVTMSTNTKETLAGSGRTRSGRHSVPSTRAQESSAKKPIGRPRSRTPPPRTFAAVSRSVSMTESVSAPLEPRRSFQRKDCPMPWSRPTKSTVVLDQPRDGQGRFGMKVSTNGRYMRKRVARKSAMSRAQRAHERDKVRSRLEGETVESGESNGENSEDHDDQEQQEQKDEAETPLRSLNGRERKRRKDLNYEPRESPKKRSRLGHGEETDSVSASDRPSLFRVPPLSTTRFGSLACRRPNPMNLARSNWVPKTYHEPDAASDSGFLSVPKDLTRLRTTDSHPLENAENWRRRFSRVPIGADEEDLPLSPVGALTFKPSPGNYAKRRWSSEVWASNATRNSSPSPSDRSDASQEIFDDDDDSDSVDINVDYKKRYSIYFITQREREVGDIDLSSWEEDVSMVDAADKYVLQRASFDESSNLTEDKSGRIGHLVDMSDDNSAHSLDERTLPKQGFRVALSMSPGQGLIIPAIN